jgi:hypothetical protein
VDAEQIKELTQAVLDLKAEMIAQDQAAQAAVQDAKDAAERALQAAEEAPLRIRRGRPGLRRQEGGTAGCRGQPGHRGGELTPWTW